MKTQIIIAADAKTLDALAKFLGEFEKLSPEPLVPVKAIRGEDNVVYVEAGYKTEEDTFVVGDRMAEVGAEIVEETGVLIALAPFVVEEADLRENGSMTR
jgi:hypothetical protein